MSKGSVDQLRELREASLASPQVHHVARKEEWPTPTPPKEKGGPKTPKVQPPSTAGDPKAARSSSPSHRGSVKGFPVLVRLQPELLAKLDRLRGNLSRPEKIRLILENAHD